MTAATCSNAFARVGRRLLPFRIMPNILAKPLKTTGILLIPPFSEAPQHFRNYHVCYFIVLFTCFHVSSSWDYKVPELGLDWDLITPWDSRAVTLSLWVYCFCPLSVYWSSVFLWNCLLKKAERFGSSLRFLDVTVLDQKLSSWWRDVKCCVYKSICTWRLHF